MFALALGALLGCGSDPSELATPESPLVQGRDGSVSDAGHGDARVGSGQHGGSTNVDDAGNVTQTCDSIVINAQPNAPEVLIVLDRSGSMIGNNPTNTNRWKPSSKVIKEITAQLDQTMHFGMMLFPDPSGGAGQAGMCAVGKLSVPIGAGTSGAIARAIDASPPTALSATPTAATLQAALTAIDAEPPCADSCVDPHRYVLLVTDGAPNCGAGFISTTQADIDACDHGIDALKASGVTTYVIGYDTAKDAATKKIMDGFAMHGGTGMQLPVEDEASLLSTLTSLAGQLISCDYKLSSQVTNPKFVKVTVDGKQVDLGSGWTLSDDQQTIVLGSACDTLRDAKPHALRITLECSQVIAI